MRLLSVLPGGVTAPDSPFSQETNRPFSGPKPAGPTLGSTVALPLARLAALTVFFLLAGLVGTAISAVPTRPGLLRAKKLSVDSVRLKWRDKSGNETNFEMQRKLEDAAFETIAFPNQNAVEYIDSITPSNVYVYRVRAQNSDGNSRWSNKCYFNHPRPARPTGLSVTDPGDGSLGLEWGDNSIDERGFHIQRKTADTKFKTVDKIGMNATSYTDGTAEAGVMYTYRVRGRGRPAVCIKDSRWSNKANGIAGNPATEKTLVVMKTGTGSGRVTSAPAGINCGSDCEESYREGRSVTVMADPNPGSIFSGWGGTVPPQCAGATGSCQFLMGKDRNVTARFDAVASRCPTNGPITDLTMDCSDFGYFYASGGIVEGMTTTGSEVVIAQTDGVDIVGYFGPVTGARTFNLTAVNLNDSPFIPLDSGSGNISSTGRTLNFTVRLSGETFVFNGATWIDTRPLARRSIEDLIQMNVGQTSPTDDEFASLLGVVGELLW